MRLVPRPFAKEIQIERDLEKDCLRVRDRSQRVEMVITGMQAMDCPEIPPKNVLQMIPWLRRNFLNIYAVRVYK